MSRYYPVMLDVEARRCLVVGGGSVAERKIGGLLEAGADVLVVSPTLTDKLSELALGGFIRSEAREYRKEDLTDAILVFAATDSRSVNEKVAAEAKAAGIPVNTADRSEEGTFITPASFRRGKLVVAVTASGASPALSARIVKELETRYGDDYAFYIEWLDRLRQRTLETIADAQERQTLLRQALDVPAESWNADCGQAEIDGRIRKLRIRLNGGITDEYRT
jgi:precorrin-2 dehydrogenase/sirohydrochlorin ferrochelatase